ISRREGRVSEQNADTAARNSLSAFPESFLTAICLKSEDDTKDTPVLVTSLARSTGTVPVLRAPRTKIKLATIR
ncbi:hypothetical protein, partial [Mesorhizobium sp. M7A.F.Ca.US.002.01.1.1]|uniref:hypothetical protein n=1 Tax=Mesorhizobium sp. M7A.F.Ca.US.002.01.1.1 TaxID=2496700 RepID=UPI0019D460C9